MSPVISPAKNAFPARSRVACAIFLVAKNNEPGRQTMAVSFSEKIRKKRVTCAAGIRNAQAIYTLITVSSNDLHFLASCSTDETEKVSLVLYLLKISSPLSIIIFHPVSVVMLLACSLPVSSKE